MQFMSKYPVSSNSILVSQWKKRVKQRKGQLVAKPDQPVSKRSHRLVSLHARVKGSSLPPGKRVPLLRSGKGC